MQVCDGKELAVSYVYVYTKRTRIFLDLIARKASLVGIHPNPSFIVHLMSALTDLINVFARIFQHYDEHDVCAITVIRSEEKDDIECVG